MKKPLLIIGILIISVAVVISALFYIQKQQEAREVKLLTSEIEKVNYDRIYLIEKIEDTDRERQRLQGELERYEVKMQQLKQDILNTGEEMETLRAELSEKESIFSRLNSKLNSVMQQESEFQIKLQKVESDYQAVLGQIEATRAEKISLEKQTQDILTTPKGVELKRIVVKVAPVLKGRILEVSEEYNFAVTDLGLKDELKVGDIMGVYRNGSFIAKAVTENIYEDMSSIIVLEEWSGVRLATGDTVRRLSS